MKKIVNIKSLLAVVVGLTLASCDQDVSVPDIPRENSSAAIVKEETVSVQEGNTFSFTIEQEALVEERFDGQEFFDVVSGQIGIRVIGGTATLDEDFSFNIPKIFDVSPFLLQDGYYYGYNASVDLEHIVNNVITIINDGQTEGTETIELQFFPVGIGSVVINDTLIVEIND
ncbi:hypothetical protein ACOSP6_08920 [Tenacibaculum sp. MEBiC06402]|uniref:hypothetical protein n=1 Tax=unclassified Tenacibaculum TaxID=2635139 RepID=UPI003B9D2E90